MSLKTLPIPANKKIIACQFGQSNCRRHQRGNVNSELIKAGFDLWAMVGNNTDGKAIYEPADQPNSLINDSTTDGTGCSRGPLYLSLFDDGAGGGKLRKIVDLLAPKLPNKTPVHFFYMQGEADAAPLANSLAHGNRLEAAINFMVADFPELDWYVTVGLPWFNPPRDPATSFVENVRAGIIAKAAANGWGVADTKDYNRTDDVHIGAPDIVYFAERIVSVLTTGTNVILP